ncbi:hypothetical protein BKA70DRAFT_646105 [Coprinopsis sp. MPI-PUGE-AT-0042]|nr:hypothetical protein BKA70DRAFT_646105 [Coprinopsis sp. MPI-PUGE-AT-0042]
MPGLHRECHPIPQRHSQQHESPHVTGWQSKYGGGGYQSSDDDDSSESNDDSNDDSSSSTTDSSSSTTSSSSSNNSTLRGDSKCSSSMCVEAQVNGDTVQYSLTSQRGTPGWMAMGFGTQMTRSPMVIMWANEDGTLTLSQRQANSYTMPAVVPDPPRVATAETALSVTSGDNQKYVFTIPANSDTNQNIIWAFGSTRPSSSDAGAQMVQHVAEGRMTLDLTRTPGSGNDTNTGGDQVPLTSNERTLLAHAVLACIGFLILLPIGALIPRYLRTFVSGWFKFHWIVQFVLGGLAGVIGIILGFVGVSNRGGVHANTTHKRVGITLLVLYILQVSLGAIVHFFKPKSWTKGGRRPIQNYIHAILGVLIIALALFQARTGYKTEWPRVTSRAATNGVNIVWYVWVVLLPVLYFAGLALLPRQFKQEKRGNARAPSDDSREELRR